MKKRYLNDKITKDEFENWITRNTHLTTKPIFIKINILLSIYI